MSVHAAIMADIERDETVAELHGLGGKPLTIKRALSGMPVKNRDPDSDNANLVSVQICRARTALPNREMIQTIRGVGFAMTPAGLTYVNRLLA